MVYPTYSKQDIKINKYPGGNHYYASLGEMTVVDSQNNQKWNTLEEAQRVSESFLSSVI
jgi:hypothetical protein